jgi:hypothetical protein
MCRRIFVVVVAMLILKFFCMPQGMAQGNSTDEIKAKLSKLGTGPKAEVRVTLKDNKKIQGWLSSIADDHFTVNEVKSGTVTTIPYADVKTVKSLRPSKGLTAGVALVVIGAAALVFLFAGAKH